MTQHYAALRVCMINLHAADAKKTKLEQRAVVVLRLLRALRFSGTADLFFQAPRAVNRVNSLTRLIAERRTGVVFLRAAERGSARYCLRAPDRKLDRYADDDAVERGLLFRLQLRTPSRAVYTTYYYAPHTHTYVHAVLLTASVRPPDHRRRRGWRK